MKKIIPLALLLSTSVYAGDREDIFINKEDLSITGAVGSHSADIATTTFAIKALGFTEANPMGAVGTLGTQVGIDLLSSGLSPKSCVVGKTGSRMAGQIGGVNNAIQIAIFLSGTVISPPVALAAGVIAGVGTAYSLSNETRNTAAKECYGDPIIVIIILPNSTEPQVIAASPDLLDLVPEKSYVSWAVFKDFSRLTIQVGEKTQEHLKDWMNAHSDLGTQGWILSETFQMGAYDFSSH